MVVLFREACRRIRRFRARRRIPSGRRQPTSAGFVLPTTTMLLLVVSLSIGAMVLRAYDHTAQTSSDRQRQEIENAASPAIDRAKAKLDYLLDRRTDPRLPPGVPHQIRLQQMLLNHQEPVLHLEGDAADPYTFPDETRLDVNGDGILDNVWRYRIGSASESEVLPDATVVYGVWLLQPGPDLTVSDVDRAERGLVRHGPLGQGQESNPLCQSRYSGPLSAAYTNAGWTADPGHPSRYRKTLQVDVLVLPDRPGQPIATLELQQDRQLHQGFPWGAWFQNDLEIASDVPLSWNGAIHTAGSLIVDSDNTVELFPVSAAASCLTSTDAHRLTTGHAGMTASPFQGYGVVGSIDGDRFGGRAVLHDSVGDSITLSSTTDDLAGGPQRPSALLLDPLAQLTAAQQVHRGLSPSNAPNGTDYRDRSAAAQRRQGRLYPKHEDLPYARDRFRADNRYGPDPDIGGQLIPGQIGEPIAGDRLLDSPLSLADVQLTRNTLSDIEPDHGQATTEPVGLPGYGLDGYWERRARAEGLRLIVSQRLQLGGLSLPWPGCPNNARKRCHEARQRRSLQDTLAAVQSTLLYPANAPDPDQPVACLLSTIHPGTATTLADSSTFLDRSVLLQDYLPEGFYTGRPIISDLFHGRGTNGWEYEPLPAALRTEADFEAAIAPSRPLGLLLRNLAHFAGDPLGGSPSFTPASPTTDVHPYPLLAAWGDVSLLRRILDQLDRPGSAPYRQLSPADKTTLHGATCTLGMLAYNVGYLTQLAYPADRRLAPWPLLIQALQGVNAQTLTTPQAVVAALRHRQKTTALPADVVTLAETIALKAQVMRDRRWGFSPGRPEDASEGWDDALQALIPTEPAFPALHYLFPLVGDSHGAGAGAGPANPWRDDYIAQINQDWRYRDVDLTNGDVLQQIAIAPRALADWWLPHRPAASGGVLSDRALYLTCHGPACSGSSGRVRLGIKDAALFDGREMLLTRVLDLDLDLLRQAAVLGANWLPDSGIIYGFRADALREDSIVRPAQTTGAACGTYTALLDPSGRCSPNAVPAASRSQDPPRSDRAISLKPIDGMPDPDRRPYGFRLRNGTRLARLDQVQGLSFITDNPVYIMGPFNLHQTPGCQDNCSLGEFKSLLPADRPYRPREFYRRHILDPRFARPQQDDWRASEIMADSITILSEQFCDGSIEDTWTTAGLAQPKLPQQTMAAYGCHSPDRRTSFLNQNRPLSAAAAPWQRRIASEVSSPVVVSAQGNPRYADGTDYKGTYLRFRDAKPLIRAKPLQINAILISAAAPSRPRQTSGGLLGQIRLLEQWKTIAFRGALVQLGVNHYSTAPLDQDAWEIGTRPQSARHSRYYALQQFLGEYDVALQYGPAPPVVSQFVTVAANPRSEFYATPAATDPYVRLLCVSVSQRCR